MKKSQGVILALLSLACVSWYFRDLASSALLSTILNRPARVSGLAFINFSTVSFKNIQSHALLEARPSLSGGPGKATRRGRQIHVSLDKLYLEPRNAEEILRFFGLSVSGLSVKKKIVFSHLWIFYLKKFDKTALYRFQGSANNFRFRGGGKIDHRTVSKAHARVILPKHWEKKIPASVLKLLGLTGKKGRNLKAVYCQGHLSLFLENRPLFQANWDLG